MPQITKGKHVITCNESQVAQMQADGWKVVDKVYGNRPTRKASKTRQSSKQK